MPSLTTVLIFLTVLVVLLPAETYAFGAGDIPDFAYLNDKAFRHGDIESILTTLAKTAGQSHGGGLLGLASSVLASATGGATFSKMDVKRVYFGNWLRDYSQAMDIAGLSKLSADTLVMIVSVLGFMTFGLATEEFQINAERLGVYLPVEHIDNPKGYGEKEGDARQFHPKLRPPVDPRELEIDERTGMKNYMATENKGWDTSTAHIRRTFENCIQAGRRAQGRDGADMWEAYRHLGSGLHTMEDLLAHSNWCEIALRKMGHREVFCHVGDQVLINTPNGSAPPLVTGTFGSADFMHSLMGEATDHISEASVTNLYDKMNNAGRGDKSSIEGLKNVLSQLNLGGKDNKTQQAEDIKTKAYNFDPDKVAPVEVQQRLLEILKWRDGVYRDVLKRIEMVPGLSELLDQFTEALNAYVYTVLAPWLTPILQQTTGVLGEGSKAVIDSDDQYEVFNNPRASDPSHSLLSKDHFGLILNEPAGKIAQLVVENTVKLIVKAWSNNGDTRQVIDQILEAFHHPYYATGRSQIQRAMMDRMERWFGGLGGEEGRQVLANLTKDSVRNGKNKRIGAEGDESVGSTTSGQSQSGLQQGHGPGSTAGRPSNQNKPGRASNPYGGSSGYGGGDSSGSVQGQHHGRAQEKFGGNDDNPSGHDGVRRKHYEQDSDSSRRRTQDDELDPYSPRRKEDESEAYGRRKKHGEDNEETHSRRRQDDEQGQYGRKNDDDDKPHGRRKKDGDDAGYSRRKKEDSNDDEHHGRRKNQGGNNEPHGRRQKEDDDDDKVGRAERASPYDSQSTFGSGGDTYGTSNHAYGSGRPSGENTYESSETTPYGPGRGSNNTHGSNDTGLGSVRRGSGAYDSSGTYGSQVRVGADNTYASGEDSYGSGRGGSHNASDTHEFGRQVASDTYGSAVDNAYGDNRGDRTGAHDSSGYTTYGSTRPLTTSSYGSVAAGGYGSSQPETSPYGSGGTSGGYQPSYQPSYQQPVTYTSNRTETQGNSVSGYGASDYVASTSDSYRGVYGREILHTSAGKYGEEESYGGSRGGPEGRSGRDDSEGTFGAEGLNISGGDNDSSWQYGKTRRDY